MPYDPTFRDLLHDLWRSKIMIITGGLLGGLIALCFLLTAVPHYRATMLIAPAQERREANPDDIAFITQHATETMGSSESGDFIRFIHILKAPSVAAILYENPEIIRGVNEDIHFQFQKNSKAAIQSPEELATYLEDHIDIEPVGNTPLQQLIYQHPDRRFASYLLGELHQATDSLIQKDIRTRTQNRMNYLENSLMRIDHPDHRRALTSLLMEQEHIQMLLAMNEPFAAMVAEPPSAGVKPYWPRRSIIFPVFILSFMLLGYMIHTIIRKPAS